MDRATIDLGAKDFAAGLSFVAISRVKTLKGMAFCKHFPWSRILKDTQTDSMKMLTDDNQRRLNLGFTLMLRTKLERGEDRKRTPGPIT